MRGGAFGGIGLIAAAVVAFLGYLSVFIVDPTEQALVLRLGQPVDVRTTPGLYFKIPVIENAVFIDKRLVDLDSPAFEVTANDQKRLVVNAFGRFRVIETLRFYQTVGNLTVAETRLSNFLNSAVREVVGGVSFIDLVKEKRAELMDSITKRVSGEARNLGVEVVDVKIRRADLPEANSQAIYQRMQTERARQAADIRAQGNQASARIRAEADREATVIVAEASRQSEQIRGDGDAAVNKIYADAYSRDTDFFAFYRSMQAYQTGLRADDTRLVIAPDSEFFRFFADPSGKAAAGPPPANGAPPAAGTPPANRTPPAGNGAPPAP